MPKMYLHKFAILILNCTPFLVSILCYLQMYRYFDIYISYYLLVGKHHITYIKGVSAIVLYNEQSLSLMVNMFEWCITHLIGCSRICVIMPMRLVFINEWLCTIQYHNLVYSMTCIQTMTTINLVVTCNTFCLVIKRKI